MTKGTKIWSRQWFYSYGSYDLKPWPRNLVYCVKLQWTRSEQGNLGKIRGKVCQTEIQTYPYHDYRTPAKHAYLMKWINLSAPTVYLHHWYKNWILKVCQLNMQNNYISPLKIIITKILLHADTFFLTWRCIVDTV